jgi:hypothetical protein
MGRVVEMQAMLEVLNEVNKSDDPELKKDVKDMLRDLKQAARGGNNDNS